MFTLGDVVQLKSGGAKMTVREVKPHCVVCVWFDAHDVLHEEEFAGEMLVKPAPS